MANFKNLSLYIKKINSKEKNNLLDLACQFCLFLFSIPYQFLVQQRNRAYDRKWLKQKKSSLPVISIGNIVAGGTGKTPLTIALANTLTQFNPNVKIAILSRGYRSKAEKYTTPLVVNRSNISQFSPDVCGDEPYLIAQSLPNCHIIVNHHRSQSAEIAHKLGMDIIILDDGLQHRQLLRDCDIIVMDAENLFGYNFCLPRGFLREPIKNLSRAHLIVINHCRNISEFHVAQNQVNQYANVPIIGLMPISVNIHRWQSRNLENVVESFKKSQVGIFCGIGKPDSFKNSVQTLEIEVVDSLYFGDHGLELDKLKTFALKCKSIGATHLICTEKDIVKLKSIASEKDFGLPIVWLEMSFKFVDEHSECKWNSFVQSLLPK